ncbi:MAG: PEP-CTERM sorting domain-containing protein [Phycisphaerae bacterium]
MRRIVAATLAMAYVSAALAGADFESKRYSGDGGPIKDASEQRPRVNRYEILVPDHGTVVDVKSVDLKLEHSHIGDLVIRLIEKGREGHPPVAAVTLLDRPGVPQSQGGNLDNLVGTYSFRAGAAAFPESGGASDNTVPPGAYGLHENGDYSVFQGIEKFGEWSLLIIDSAPGHTGHLDGWRVVMNNVPEPGSIVLLALAASGLIPRR